MAYVLRTGFGSAQGELMQMIEFSQQTVSSDTRETLGALGILLESNASVEEKLRTLTCKTARSRLPTLSKPPVLSKAEIEGEASAAAAEAKAGRPARHGGHALRSYRSDPARAVGARVA